MSEAMPCVGFSQAYCTSSSIAVGGPTCQWDPKIRQCMDVSAEPAAIPIKTSSQDLLGSLTAAGSAPLGGHHVRSVQADPGAAHAGIPRIPLQPRPASSNDEPMDCKAFCASQGFDVSTIEAPDSSGNCFCKQKGPLGFDSDSMADPRPTTPFALQFPLGGP